MWEQGRKDMPAEDICQSGGEAGRKESDVWEHRRLPGGMVGWHRPGGLGGLSSLNFILGIREP